MAAPVADSSKNDELREFLLVLRDALLLVVRYIEKKYWVNK
jgi:hypothetical protein